MHSRLFFIAAVAIVLTIQGLSHCSSAFYYAVNTYGDLESLTLSCFGNNTDCSVYYSPPGSGCSDGGNDDTLMHVGVIPNNGSRNVTGDFLLGGGFCSDYQIGVYYIGRKDGLLIELPRATEAGTKFRLGLFKGKISANYQCVMSALSFPANIAFSFDISDVGQTISLGRFETHQFNFTVNKTASKMIQIASDHPVIVSCTGPNSPKPMINLQPISPKPVLVSFLPTVAMSVVISDCSTNELITNFSKVRMKFANDNGGKCYGVKVENPMMIRMDFTGSCSVYIEPIDNVCIAAGIQSEKLDLTQMGIPFSKFSTRFVGEPRVGLVEGYSFLETSCKGYYSRSSKFAFNFRWMYGDLKSVLTLSDQVNFFGRTQWLICEDPILVVMVDEAAEKPILSAYQSEELWKPFFEAERVANLALSDSNF